jgi:membrane dipeptidase
MLRSVQMPFSRRSLLRQLPLAALAGGFHIRVGGQEAKALWVTGNPAIDKPRQIALDLLQPTQAQIEHAWELHFG